MLTFRPSGSSTSPACMPAGQGPSHLASIAVLPDALPASGGSYVALISMWYAVSPVNVVTDVDFIVDSPNLHSALPYIRLPSRRISFFAQSSFICPIPASIISFWSEASVHIFIGAAFCGPPSRATCDSHKPALSVGKSTAAALAAARASAPPRAATSSGIFMRGSPWRKNAHCRTERRKGKPTSDRVEVDVLVHGHRLECLLVEARREDCRLLLRGEAAREVH